MIDQGVKIRGMVAYCWLFGYIGINGRYQGLQGLPPILRKSFNDLSPGDRILQIGVPNKNGNETPTSRVWRPYFPFTYRGFFLYDDDEQLAFEMDKREFPEWVNGPAPPHHKRFALFGIVDQDEIALTDHKTASALFYKAVFEKEPQLKLF